MKGFVGFLGKPVVTEADLVDEVAGTANGAKFTWSDRDKEDMRLTARSIIDKVRMFDGTPPVEGRTP